MDPRPISLRPVEQADEELLFGLFVAGLRHSFAALGLPPSQSAALLRMQFQAQSRAFCARHAGADFHIVLLGDEPVGRLYVDERARHAGNGVRLRPYILKLDRPLCVNGMLPQDDGTVDPYVPEIHVATMKRRPDLRPLKDTKVRVHGRPMGAMTAWHARPRRR